MKLVSVTMRVEVSQPYRERRDALDQRWHPFLAACGLGAFPTPNRPELASACLDHVVGLVLTGGNDLCQFGGDAPDRDATESLLLETAIAWKLPVIGICRGMQFLGDYFGCMLARLPGHAGTRHAVRQLDGDGGAMVNSYHNYCVTAPGTGIEPMLVASDGSIEAFRHTSLPVYGIMWHPEREDVPRTEDVALFRSWFGTSS